VPKKGRAAGEGLISKEKEKGVARGVGGGNSAGSWRPLGLIETKVRGAPRRSRKKSVESTAKNGFKGIYFLQGKVYVANTSITSKDGGDDRMQLEGAQNLATGRRFFMGGVGGVGAL